MKFASIALLMFFCVHQLQHRTALIPLIAKALPTPPLSLSPEDARAMIRAAAAKHNVPAAFVKSIVAAESNFNPAAVSPKGAIGLMQLMPATAQEYGVDPLVPAQNIDGGTRYLHALMQRYQRSRDWLRRTIAAYNAGPAMVDKYHGVPPFHETRTYVARVLAYMRRFTREREA
jgi:soluble lytic murein transglycosylase-like protein